jgi:undecaprenyl-diphosphatase
MGVGQAIVLGIIQGLGEFLPISSSAHLALAHWITGWDLGAADLAFDVMLHVGTLLALLLYFGKDWIALLQRWREPMLRLVLVACIPGAIFGALLEKTAEGPFRDKPLRIAFMLVLFGLVMAVAEFVSKQTRELKEVGWKDAIWIGLSQALAIMPGVSRSGVTITAGMFLGMTREAAARFSFLLSVPIVAGAALWEGRKLMHGGLPVGAAPVAAGILAAAIVGLLAIHFLLRFLQRHTLYGFTVYRILVALMVVALVLRAGTW